MVIAEYADDEGCFKAKNEDTDVEVVLCTLASVTHITLKQNRDEWIKQIGFFRDHCRQTIPVEAPDLDIADIKKQEVEMETEEAQAAAAPAQSGGGGGGGGGGGSEEEEVSKMAVDAMAKEAKYEKLAEKEELDREVMEELNDRKKVE